jgi:hypothetical protein
MSIDPASIPSFDAPQPVGPPPIVRPDRDMVTQLLDQMEIKHAVDEESDVYAGWEGFRVYFMFRGEAPQDIYAVRSFYDRKYPAERKAELLEAIDEWNRDTLWPKVYTHALEDGELRLIGEAQLIIGNGVNIDYFAGQTVNWTQAAVGFNGWITDRMGPEQTGDEAADGADDKVVEKPTEQADEDQS